MELASTAVSALFDKILLTHSQSGGLGWRTAIKNRNVRAIVSYEPGGNFFFLEGDAPPAVTFASGAKLQPTTVPVADFMLLTKIPVLVYYGDNIPEKPTAEPVPISGACSWPWPAIGEMQ